MAKTTEDRVIQVIVESLAVDGDKVKVNSTFDELGADSLDKIEIAMDLEAEFNVPIDGEDWKLNSLNTVQDVVILVDKLLGKI